MWAWSDFYRDQKAKLNPSGLKALVEWFQDKGFSQRDSQMFAEALASRHRHDWRESGRGPRHSEIHSELGALIEATIAFKDAIEGLSEGVKSGLAPRLFHRAPGGFADFAASQQTDISRVATLLLHSEAIPAFEMIIGASKDLIAHTPKDKGGMRSGRSDVSGAEAKRRLIVELRSILGALALPVNSAKGKGLSECFDLVHWAASGDESSGQADDYAEKAPALEREIPIF